MLAPHLGKPLTQVPDPFGTHPSFGAAQQCAAARLPRPLRLRLRVPVVDRLLQVRPLRRGAADDARALRRGDGRSCCRRCARSARRPIRRSCRSRPRTGIVLQVPIVAHDAKAGTITYEDPDTERARRHAGHRRPLQAAMEARLGDALGRARRRLRDGRQGPDRLGQALGRDLPRARRRSRRRASTTSSSSTRRARRSPSPRATA